MSKPSRTPDAVPIPANNTSYDEDDFKARLADEYKILQDKIDKIGGFRFTIKGWSVTAVLAALAAAGSTGNLLTVFSISVGLIVMLFFFHFLEYEQVSLSRRFGNRAGRIEDAFKSIDRGTGEALRSQFRVPYTAHEVVLGPISTITERTSQLRNRIEKRNRGKWSERWRTCRQAHVWFYITLMFLALAPLLTHYSDIQGKWKAWKANAEQTKAPNIQRTPQLPQIRK